MSIIQEIKGRTFVSDWMPAPIEMPEGHCEIVVGDSHGYEKTLRRVVSEGLSINPDAHLTFTGDVISRGPNSMGALKFALGITHERKGRGTFLYGNHEIALLGHLAGVKAFDPIVEKHGGWLHYDYKISRKLLRSALEKGLGSAAYNLFTRDGLMWSDRIKSSMKDVLYRSIGNVVMVHAGIPGHLRKRRDVMRYLKKMKPYDMNGTHPLWLKSGFLDSDHDYDGLVVIHGHTIESKIPTDDGFRPVGQHFFDRYRIGVDAGSYLTGMIAGVMLRNGQYRYITAKDYDF